MPVLATTATEELHEEQTSVELKDVKDGKDTSFFEEINR